jgi:hypothetical protein
MFPGRRNLSLTPVWLQFFLVCVIIQRADGENVVLRLKNGDQISGFVVSEYTNRLVLSNGWSSELSVPLAQIERREIMAPGATNQSAGANALRRAREEAAATTPPLFKHWKGEAEVGLDLLYSTSDQQTYHGLLKLSYELPYKSDPKMFFRNTLEYSVDYGKTEQMVDGVKQTVTSADKMGGVDKTSGDFTRKWYAYNLAGVGYDRVSKIALQAELGPGIGYHLFTATNFTANVETGINYQIQDTTDNTHTRDFFYRVAQDVNWKITPRTTWSEKTELFPRVNFAEYRFRAESTLSYNLWRYMYLNLTVRDTYNTEPADDASANELEFHTALGLKF